MVARYGEHIYSKYGFVDAFNPSFRYEVTLKHGRVVPGFGWVATDYLGIDQGPILAMIANFTDGSVWQTMTECAQLRRGLQRAGLHRRLARGRADGRAGAVAVSPIAEPVARAALRVAAPARARWRWRAAARATARALRFWAMGREGEVVGELLARLSSASTRRSRVRVEKLPWTAAHEKLLTAFAGDATPDMAQLGNTWIAELAALGALEPLQRRGLDAAGIAPRDYFDGIWHTNQVDGHVVRRAVVRRHAAAVLSPRPLRARRHHIDARQTGPASCRRSTRCSAPASPHPLLLPLNEFEPLLALALQQDDPLLRDGGRYGNFRSAGLSARAGVLPGALRARPCAVRSPATRSPTCGRSSAAARSRSSSPGPWNIGEFDRRLPAELRDRWTHRAAARPDRPRRVDRRRLEPRDLPPLAAQGRGDAAARRT